MGFWDYFWDSELKQRSDINRQNESIGYAQSKIHRLEDRIRSLTVELNKTKRCCKVLLEVVVEQGLITEEDFLSRVQAADESAGGRERRGLSSQEMAARQMSPLVPDESDSSE